MSKDIKIKKGLDIKLKGEAQKTKGNAIVSKYCTIRPEDFHGIIPKLVAKEGTSVKAGETVFYNKDNEAMKFVSPVSGQVSGKRKRRDRQLLPRDVAVAVAEARRRPDATAVLCEKER